jgi:Ca2+-binding RTX toxin-like protein
MARFVATSAAETFENDHTTVIRKVNIGGHGYPDIYVNKFYDDFQTNIVDYSNSSSAVFIDLTADVQHGGFAEGDTLINMGQVDGSRFNDVIRGSDPVVSNLNVIDDPGNNVLRGLGGDDVLEGRGGADTLDGGADNDTASYESSPTGVQVTVNDPDHNGAFVATGGDAAGDTLISIENLIGSAYDDILTGASNANTFIGGRGNDIIDGGRGTDTVDYSTENIDHVEIDLSGSGAAEFISMPADHASLWVSTDHLYNIENIIGTSGADRIVGNSLDNLFDAGFGNDVIDGAGGTNTVTFESWDATGRFVMPNTATIRLGSAGQDGSADRFLSINHSLLEHDTLRNIQNVTGSNFSETITGNEQRNTIEGRGGNDTIDGGFGNDVLDGGSGVNTVSFASHDNAVTLTDEQISIVLGRDGADGFIDWRGIPGEATIRTSFERDTLRNFQNVTGSNHGEGIEGNDDDNTLNGRGGDDVIGGGEGHDTLLGGDGNDVLAGDRGADTLTGGRDADRFIFGNVDESANQPGAFDTITDFEAGIDQINVSHIDANATTTLFENFHFPLAGFALHVGEIGSFYDAARNVTVVEANTTGAAVNDFHLELLGHINLTANDFILTF